MINIALLGAGRIGLTHALAVYESEGAKLSAVFEPDPVALNRVMELTGARAATIEQLVQDKDIDAVIIATPSDLHAEQIELFARAGKNVFCEKPIHLEVDRVKACLRVVKESRIKMMVGFNRRFDANFIEVRKQIDAGAIGDVELVQITSRDPAPPPISYIKHSGGLFRDMMIHDFDMARFLLGEEVIQVTATGSVLVDDEIGGADDVDTATATLRTASGKIAVITNSRRASYGYDQRVEVHGSKGLVSAENQRETTVTVANELGYRAEPLEYFFMQRYAKAYKNELMSFVRCINENTSITPDGNDGLQALVLADAAVKSMLTGVAVNLV